jgi:hypothetical protein
LVQNAAAAAAVAVAAAFAAAAAFQKKGMGKQLKRVDLREVGGAGWYVVQEFNPLMDKRLDELLQAGDDLKNLTLDRCIEGVMGL